MISKENDLNIDPKKRIDLFSLNVDVNNHNEAMIEKINEKSHIVEAELSFMGDEPAPVKKKLKEAMFLRKNHTETLGLRLCVERRSWQKKKTNACK